MNDQSSAVAPVARGLSTAPNVARLVGQAENALSVALFHLRQPAINVPGAARKAVQALAALNQLRGLADGNGTQSKPSEG